MAIAFNLPSEREAAEENYSRLNRLLAELYDVLCHILVSSRQQQSSEGISQEQRPRDRPFSESDAQDLNLNLPDIVQAPLGRSRRRLLSIDSPGNFSRDVWKEGDDDVFNCPSPFEAKIFGSPGTRKTPAGVLLSPRLKSERIFTFPPIVTDPEQTIIESNLDESDGSLADRNCQSDLNSLDAQSKPSSLPSIFSEKISGTICTAVLFVFGWRYWNRSR